jgi:endonuclease-3
LAVANLIEVEEHIRSTGFYRAKARNIVRARERTRRRIRRRGAEQAGASSSTLAGVGRKTANVVLGNAFDTPGLTVDTHMGRLARRFGWTEETDPVKAEHEIAALFPKKDLTLLSHRVIFHGRRICHSRKPACGACPLAALCPSFGIGELDPDKARAMLRFEMAPEATVAEETAPATTARTTADASEDDQ